MAKPPTVLDVFCECLQIIQELPPDDRPRVITALGYVKDCSGSVLKCPPSEASAPATPREVEQSIEQAHADIRPHFTVGPGPASEITGEDGARVLTIRRGDAVSDRLLGMRFDELRIDPSASAILVMHYVSRLIGPGRIFVGDRELKGNETLRANVFNEVEIVRTDKADQSDLREQKEHG